MRMRRLSLLLSFLAPVALVATGFAALARAAPAAQPGAEPSGCVPDLRKWAEPESLVLGQTAQVSLVVSNTCPMRYLPVDLIILADESNSMTRRRTSAAQPPGEPTRPPIPDPSAPPPTPVPPGPITTPGGPPISDPRGGEPPFCNPRSSNLPSIPVETQPPRPDPSGEPPPPATQGPIIPPGTRPASDPPDIESLEPAGGFDWVREEKSWVRDFMNQPEIERDIASGRLRVGFVSFNERARIRQPITDGASKIVGAANRMRGGEVTYISQGLRTAETMMRGSGSRKTVERVQIIVLLSDFQFCQRDMRRVDKDIQLIAVGFGVRPYDQRKQFDLATDRRFVLTSRDVRGVVKVYEDVIAKGSRVETSELTVSDQLAENMMLVPGSARPPTVTLHGQLLEWSFAPPSLPVTLTYRVEPLEPGQHLVSEQAGVSWRDSEKLVGSGTFPTVTLNVLAPTPTPTNTPTITPSPTATDTPTPTFTPTPAARYLPILYRQRPPTVTPVPSPTVCVPESQTVDLALVIDTSGSMSQPTQPGGALKLHAAIEAAVSLVGLLKDNDQTAVVWFNNNAGLLLQLTTDKAAVVAALRSLPDTTASGTAMHLGIRTATAELVSERHRPENNQSLIMLTDGQQTHPDGVQPVREAAAAAKAAGINVVTVGLGMDVDHELLRDVASEPELYFHAPNAEDLEAIYIAIADLIPCK